MSVSASMHKAQEAQRILGIKLYATKEWCPVLRTFNDKWILVQCRVCLGAGINKVDGGSCERCKGDGCEKLSPKAIRRAAKKMELEK